MDQEYFRNFAKRCRELAGSARRVMAREQLHLWAEEFEARAQAVAGTSEPYDDAGTIAAGASAKTPRRSTGGGEQAAR